MDEVGSIDLKVLTMKVFKATGSFKMGRVWQKFSKEIISENEDRAKEKVLSIIGSKHGTKRTNIRIRDIVEIGEDEVEDLVVRDLLMEE